jgi:small-conductance mechanosensitive channel
MLAGALVTFESVRQYGVSLFASAGVVGLAVGLAARPVLSNLIAGIQIAMTQPIRLEDAVVVENEFGWIEEIAAAYVVVRVWDQRRLVVPLSYFIEKPFQNWTLQRPELIGTVDLYLDYAARVDRIREKLDEIVSLSPLWDRRVAKLQVADANETTIMVRALVSAKDAGALGDLRNEVRERLLSFLRDEHPEALPRRRAEVALQDRAHTAIEPAVPDAAPKRLAGE